MPSRFRPADDEIVFSAVRSQGAGGQNVHKVSSAAHLRFDIPASRLPEAVKHRLLASGDQRITREGVVVIKAQDHRSLARNRQCALDRLQAMIDDASQAPRVRIPTRPGRAAERRRLQAKRHQGAIKAQRSGRGPDG